MESISEKLQSIFNAGLLPDWELTLRDDGNRAFLTHPGCAGHKNVGVLFFAMQNSRNRIVAKAYFPEFMGFVSGELETEYITLGITRPNDAFVRDLERRLLTPFLAALPAAIKKVQDWKTDEEEKVQILDGLRSRIAGDVWGRAGDDNYFGATVHNLFPGARDDTYIKAKVRAASRGKHRTSPASVDLELNSVPPQLAAAILDLLSEESTN